MHPEGAIEKQSPPRMHLQPWVDRLMRHPIYEELSDETSLRLFMRSHAFAVWDFQSILKALQRCHTCVTVPWLPTPDPEARRFVNEIVLDEESDEAPGGGFLSHYELYVEAMKDCGADTSPIEGVLSELQSGRTPSQALAGERVPRGVAAFVQGSLRIAASTEPHRIAAAFAYGREEVIPGMFQQVVFRLADLAPQRWSMFRYYLERHIGTDADNHAPKARALVANLCGSDERLWAEAEETARIGLEARLQLWDETLAMLRSERSSDG